MSSTLGCRHGLHINNHLAAVVEAIIIVHNVWLLIIESVVRHG